MRYYWLLVLFFIPLVYANPDSMLKIGEARIVADNVLISLEPLESARIDYLYGTNPKIHIMLDNLRNIELYDVRLSINNEVYRISYINTSTYIEHDLNHYFNNDKGSYMLDVKLTARDRHRFVHSDSTRFFINIGVDGTNKDPTYTAIAKQYKTSQTVKSIIFAVILMICIIGVIGYFIYHKYKQDLEEY